MGRIERCARAAALLVLFLAVVRGPAEAEPFRIGFTGQWPADNLLSGEGPRGRILRSALADGLTKHSVNDHPGFTPALADRIEVSADYSAWSFKIREEAVFANGMKVRETDVIYSLERCRKGPLGSLIKSVSSGRKGTYDGARWVAIEVAKESGAYENPALLPLLLADCPVVERASSAVFGDDLGAGANLVSSGLYVVSLLRPGRLIELERSRFVSSDVPGPDKLELRFYRDAFQALTALRTGGLDILFTMDPEALDNQAGDDTLRREWCMESHLLVRRGAVVECSEELDLTKLGYSS